MKNRDHKKGARPIYARAWEDVAPQSNNHPSAVRVTVTNGVQAIASQEAIIWAIKQHMFSVLREESQEEDGDTVSHFRNSQTGDAFLIVTDPATRSMAVLLPEELYGPLM